MLRLFEIINSRHPRSCHPARFVYHATVLVHKAIDNVISIYGNDTAMNFSLR